MERMERLLNGIKDNLTRDKLGALYGLANTIHRKKTEEIFDEIDSYLIDFCGIDELVGKWVLYKNEPYSICSAHVLDGDYDCMVDVTPQVRIRSVGSRPTYTFLRLAEIEEVYASAAMVRRGEK